MKKLTKVFHRIFSPGGKGLGEGGFTLIELLVVVAILGVLAAVVTLNVGGFIGKGQDEAACTELHNVQTAAVAYMAANPAVTTPTMDNIKTYLMGTPSGTYTIATGGKVTQTAFDGGAACINQ